MDNVGNLSILCIPSLRLNDRTELCSIASLIVSNYTTLQHLDLGVEKSVIECHNRGKTYRDTNTAKELREEILAGFKSDQPFYLPKFDSLKLRGLDLGCMIGGEQHRLLNSASLKHLALESCSAMSQSLHQQTASSLRGLQTFHIRQEKYGDNFLECLKDFLCNLPPLTALSILLNGPFPGALKIEQIMEVHATSLRSCIMDLREGDRIATVKSRDAWRQQYSVNVIEPCTNLVELGISVDWEILDLGSDDSLKVHG